MLKFAALLTAFAASALPGQDGDKPDLRALLVVPPGDFRDDEYEESRKALEKAGFKCQVASQEAKEIKGMLGLVIKADVDLARAQRGLEYVTAVVFVGGSGTTRYFEHQPALDLVRAAVAQRKLIGAICLAPSLLARAGVLKGRKATVWASEDQTLRAHGATYVAEPVVVDGRFVTGNGPDAAAAFGKALVDWHQHRTRSREQATKVLERAMELREEGEHAKARQEFQAVYVKHRSNLYIGSRALFELGMTCYFEKRYADAVDAFDRVGTEYPESDHFGMATFNAAMISDRNLGRKRRAIAFYRRLVAGDCNDWDPTGALMTPYRNYRHKALLNIGHLLLELDEPAAALQVYVDSYHRGYFVSHCGTCLAGANRSRQASAARAAAALTGVPVDKDQPAILTEAEAADAYLLALGLRHWNQGDKENAGKIFAALRKAFPKSPVLGKIPRGGR